MRQGPRPGGTGRDGLRLLGGWGVVVVISLLALMGASHIAYDDGLARTFESDSPHFHRFVRFQNAFANTGDSVFLVLQGSGLEQVSGVQAVQDFTIDLSLADGVGAVLSPFSLDQALSNDGPRLSRLPVDVTDEDLTLHFERVISAKPDVGRLLSLDPLSMLIVVQPSTGGGPNLFATIEDLASSLLTSQDITLTKAGYGVVRASIIERLFGDFAVLIALGIALGTLVSAFALQSLVLALLVAFIATISLLWVLGAMGFLGVPINVVTVALPALILVLAFSDALHLSFETRRQARDKAAHPIRQSLRRVGPACVLASVTTAIAFSALTLSSSALVVQLGQTGALAALVAVIAVLIVYPVLMATLAMVVPLRSYFVGSRGSPPSVLSWPGLWHWVGRRPVAESAVTCSILAAAVVLYLNVPLTFSLYENIDDDQPTVQAAAHIEEMFGSTGTLHYVLALDPALDGADLRAAHQTLVRVLDGYDVVSLAGFESRGVALSGPARNRWITDDGRLGVFSVAFAYRDSATTRTAVAEIEARLAADPQAANLALDPATGLEAMTAFVSQDILRDMNRSFLVAVGVSALIVGLWLRDPLAGLVALVPNVLPIALVGAWLSISGQGLDFASAIALIIAFGLAIDDTVHVLNRLRLNMGGAIWSNRDETLHAIGEVAPILVITSLVLSFGLAGTQGASLPGIVLFGQLSIAVFVLALIADLIVLPAFVLAIGRLRGTRSE